VNNGDLDTYFGHAELQPDRLRMDGESRPSLDNADREVQAPQVAREGEPDRAGADHQNVDALSTHLTLVPGCEWRDRLHLSAGGVAIVVTITMMTTAEKIPSSTIG
jgi:hypothetical protein